MKNIYEMLRQKEAEIDRLKREVQALLIVAPLLEEAQEQAEVAVAPLQTYPTEAAKPVAMPTAAAKRVWP